MKREKPDAIDWAIWLFEYIVGVSILAGLFFYWLLHYPG
jgi:hypothetical protein